MAATPSYYATGFKNYPARDPAVNVDKIEFYISLVPGIYTVKYIRSKNIDGGIASLDLMQSDGTTLVTNVLSGVDHYGSPISYNYAQVAASINLTAITPGIYRLKLYPTGKNGSSSSWVLYCQSIAIYRTA